MEGIDFGWLMNAMTEPDATDPVSDSFERSRVLQAVDTVSRGHGSRDERAPDEQPTAAGTERPRELKEAPPRCSETRPG
jgi:hypothetical protein